MSGPTAGKSTPPAVDPQQTRKEQTASPTTPQEKPQESVQGPSTGAHKSAAVPQPVAEDKAQKTDTPSSGTSKIKIDNLEITAGPSIDDVSKRDRNVSRDISDRISRGASDNEGLSPERLAKLEDLLAKQHRLEERRPLSLPNPGIGAGKFEYKGQSEAGKGGDEGD